MPLSAILWASSLESRRWVEGKTTENLGRSSVYRTAGPFGNDRKGAGFCIWQWPGAILQLQVARAKSSLSKTSTVSLPVPHCEVSPAWRKAHRGERWGHLAIGEMELVFVFSLERSESPLKISYSTSAEFISKASGFVKSAF